MRVDLIYRALAKRHSKDFFVTECKSGPTQMAAKGELFIFDAIAVKKSWSRPCVTIYEVKTSRSDFLSDNKWANYRQFCNNFYFVCPKGIILPDELSNGVGLVTYNPEADTLYTSKKAVFQDNPLPVNVFYYILMNKIDNERHPFFSNHREEIIAWVADKTERQGLSYLFRSKLSKEYKSSIEKIRNLEDKIKGYEYSDSRYENIAKILRSFGFDSYNHMRLKIQLEELSNVKMLPQINNDIWSIIRAAERLKPLMEEK